MVKKLIFVYNLDGTWWQRTLDLLKYYFNFDQCRLHSLTRHFFGVRKKWQKCVQFLPYQQSAWYRGQLFDRYPAFKNVPLPAIFLVTDQDLKQLVGPKEIAKLSTISDLKRTLRDQLSKISF